MMVRFTPRTTDARVTVALAAETAAWIDQCVGAARKLNTKATRSSVIRSMLEDIHHDFKAAETAAE